mgnify:CR=1 FL=1|tara:strand:+ start:3012 stop:3533 length:522 start_codon:yes stop_codon:yes gene_type:complete
MACSLTINGRAFPCKDKIGGIKRVWIKAFDAADWGAITNGVIAAASSAAITVFGFELTKNSGSFQQTVTASVENGTVFYSQVLEISMPNLVAADNVEIADLLKNRLCVIVQDNNDNYFLMGHTTGAEATGGTVGTGTAKGDLNGYQIQLTAEEAIPAPFVASDDSEITFTPGT